MVRNAEHLPAMRETEALARGDEIGTERTRVELASLDASVGAHYPRLIRLAGLITRDQLMGGLMTTGLRRASTGLVCSLALMLAACGGSAPTAQQSPSTVATTTPEPTITTLGRGERRLEVGTYRLDLNQLAGGGTGFPAFLATVPDGWSTIDGWILNRPRSGEDIPPIAVQFWDVDQVYGHPCQWSGTLFQPGPTVDDLAEALVDVPLRNATQPIDVTLDGYAGKSLEWSVPADIEMDEQGDFPDCDLTDDGHRDFKSWTGEGWSSNRYQQGPGQVDRLWILDIDGARLVIDAFSMPYATAEELEELLAVVESIRFER